VAGSERRKITRPSSITPIGPRPGLSNASSDDVCAFVTSSAVKMRSDMNTIVPHPRDSFAAATRTAPARFPGPSHPNSLDVRIAPVKTIGFSPSTERARR